MTMADKNIQTGTGGSHAREFVREAEVSLAISLDYFCFLIILQLPLEKLNKCLNEKQLENSSF